MDPNFCSTSDKSSRSATCFKNSTCGQYSSKATVQLTIAIQVKTDTSEQLRNLDLIQ